MHIDIFLVEAQNFKRNVLKKNNFLLIKRGIFSSISMQDVLQLSWLSKAVATWLSCWKAHEWLSILIFSSWARNCFSSAFWSFFTPGQTSGFGLGSFEWSSPVLSHCMDAAAVSPSGSGIKLSLHFWGTYLLSWFYWGKIPPLITPH